MRAGAALAALAVAGLPGSALAQRTQTADAVVQGSVLNHDTALPIAGAAVRLIDVSTEEQGLVPILTNEEGHFAFRRVPEGTYLLRAEMLGYQPRQDTLVLERGTEIRVTLELAVSPVQLDPLRVEVVSRPSYNMEQFEARRARLHGSFLDREAIEDRLAIRVSDLFLGLPSVSVVGGRPNNLRGIANRCPMPVYVDGIRTGESIDNAIPPDAIEAMEVYTSLGEVPVQYRTGPCGVVLIWTRGQVAPSRASPRQGGILWKGVLAVAGVVSLLWLASH